MSSRVNIMGIMGESEPCDTIIPYDITIIIEKIKSSGHEAAQNFPNRNRSLKKRLFKISNILRQKSNDKKEQIYKINAEMVSIAKEVMLSAKEVKDKLSCELQPVAEKMEHYLGLLTQVISQTEEVLKGNTHIPNRVSLTPRPGPSRKVS